MGGEKFWKGLIVFGLAFGTGFFITEPFVPDENPPAAIVLPENPETLPAAAAPETNCVPADVDPRYEYLGAVKETPSKTEAPPAENEIKEAAEKVSKKKTEIRGAAQKPYYVPSRDPASYRILLYRERCFQPAESK